jgi:predicted nucleotidyltransferase
LALEGVNRSPPGRETRPADRQIVRTFAARVRESEPDARLWAFGSGARGDADHESDLDVCVVLPRVTLGLRQRIREAASDVGYAHGLEI